MATIHIEDLRLQTIVGINDWERTTRQDVVINVRMECNVTPAILSDQIEDTCDYKTLTKAIITIVEESSYFLVEKLAAVILDRVHEDERITEAWVRVDKPRALRSADSVAVELRSADRP